MLSLGIPLSDWEMDTGDQTQGGPSQHFEGPEALQGAEPLLTQPSHTQV